MKRQDTENVTAVEEIAGAAPAKRPPSLAIGQTLGGRFAVLRHIGDGGTGSVFAARDLLLGDDVALKVLHRTGDDASLRRLRDEVRAARRIAHPNVCRVHDLGELDGRVFVVMELLAGTTLREHMRGGVTLGEGLEILRQLAAGLGAAHRAGVVHCDVKPENALLGPDRRVVLTDFGIARLAGTLEPGRDAPIEGTPAYMAPEQLLGESVDERTDVWALAVIASELLLRAHPFGAAASMTLLALSSRVLADEPELPDERPAELDGAARALLRRALGRGLAREPAGRFDDVAALVAAIAAAAGPAAAARAAARELDAAPFTPPRHTPPRRAPTPVRRLCTIAHVLVDDPTAGDEERATERVEAMLDVAEAALTDAGGAVVARVVGAVVAAFGARVAQGDEPQRAAAAVRAVAAAGAGVVVRAGIDTGRVLVRAGATGALTVAGDAPARAAALAAAAAPGEALASERTARHLARRFVLEPVAGGVRIAARARAAARAAPLVGREDELARLIDTLAAAAPGGRPRGALIVGPPGAGKSRLAREAAPALASRGFRAVAAAATPDDALAPHAVLRALLRELGEVNATLPIAAAARAALARAQPLLLVVEDAHWADDATLDWLEELARGGVEAPVALLVEARADLLERRPRSADGWALRLELGPLPPARARELAARCLGARADAATAAAIAEAADGNPFSIEELARDYLERGDDAGAPSTVEEAIQARLDRLGGPAREALRAAAVLGRTFRRAELAALLAGDDDVDACLDELGARRLLHALPPDAEHDDRYAVVHDLIRDVAYRELAPATRRALHAAAARQVGAGAGLAELARHLEGADQREEALAAYRRAGDLALAAGAPADALRCLARARSLAGDAPDADLLLALAEAALDAGAYAECEQTTAAVLAAAPPARVAARALQLRAGLAKQRGRWEEAVALARRGLTLVADADDAVLAARLHGALGWVLGYILGDVNAGLRECLRAVELLAGSPHLDELGRAYGALGGAYMRAGRWRDQLGCNRKELELGERLGSLELVARAHLNLGVNLQGLGELEESLEHGRTALALYQRMCVPAMIGLARNNLGYALVDAGRLVEAAAELDEAARLSELAGGLYYDFEVALSRARVAGRRGDLDAARRHAAAAVAVSQRDGGRIDEGISRRILGAILSLSGRHDDAIAELEAAGAILAAADIGESARVTADRARAALRRGDDDAAAALFADAEARLTALGAAVDLAHLRDPRWI